MVEYVYLNYYSDVKKNSSLVKKYIMICKYDMLEFSKRIKKIIELSGSAEKLANISGMSSRVIGQYLAGKSDPSRIKLMALANAAQVNIEWLATGVGPMRKKGRDIFNTALLALIIELSEDHEKEAGKKLTPADRADFISTAYDLCVEVDPASDQARDLIRDSMKAVHNFLASLDRMIETEKGRERAKKLFTREFGKILPKDEAELEAQEFIGTRILKRHTGKGILK